MKAVSTLPALRRKSRGRTRPLRLMFVSGPGDVAGTYGFWREGQDDPNQVNITYSSQFFDVCRELDALSYAVALHPRRASIAEGKFRILHRAPPFAHSRSAILYYLGQLWSALGIMARAIHFRADVLVHAGGSGLWFAFRPLPIFGIAVVPALHGMLHKKYEGPPSQAQRWIRHLDRAFWSRSVSAIMSMSTDISNQIARITAGQHAPIVNFLPTYRPGALSSDPPSLDNKKAFRVLFAGRIEADKGVFDLLTIARRIAALGHEELEFHLCGNGSALNELTAQVEDSGLCRQFRLHGNCDRTVMREMFQNCHVVIVPTTTDCTEGFNKVVVEGLLAGRPVITSSVCPAIEYARDAILEVPPNDVNAYQAAILQLRSDEGLYARKRAACLSLQQQFYDPSRSWAAALRKVLNDLESPQNSPLQSRA